MRADFVSNERVRLTTCSVAVNQRFVGISLQRCGLSPNRIDGEMSFAALGSGKTYSQVEMSVAVDLSDRLSGLNS